MLYQIYNEEHEPLCTQPLGFEGAKRNLLTCANMPTDTEVIFERILDTVRGPAVTLRVLKDPAVNSWEIWNTERIKTACYVAPFEGNLHPDMVDTWDRDQLETFLQESHPDIEFLRDRAYEYLYTRQLQEKLRD